MCAVVPVPQHSPSYPAFKSMSNNASKSPTQRSAAPGAKVQPMGAWASTGTAVASHATVAAGSARGGGSKGGEVPLLRLEGFPPLQSPGSPAPAKHANRVPASGKTSRVEEPGRGGAASRKKSKGEGGASRARSPGLGADMGVAAPSPPPMPPHDGSAPVPRTMELVAPLAAKVSAKRAKPAAARKAPRPRPSAGATRKEWVRFVTSQPPATLFCALCAGFPVELSHGNVSVPGAQPCPMQQTAETFVATAVWNSKDYVELTAAQLQTHAQRIQQQHQLSTDSGDSDSVAVLAGVGDAGGPAMHVLGVEVVEMGAPAGAGKAGRKAIARTPARSRERDKRDPFAIVAEAFDSDPLVIWQGADAAVTALRKECKHTHGFDTITVQRIAPAVFALAAQLTAAVDVLGRLAHTSCSGAKAMLSVLYDTFFPDTEETPTLAHRLQAPSAVQVTGLLAALAQATRAGVASCGVTRQDRTMVPLSHTRADVVGQVQVISDGYQAPDLAEYPVGTVCSFTATQGVKPTLFVRLTPSQRGFPLGRGDSAPAVKCDVINRVLAARLGVRDTIAANKTLRTALTSFASAGCVYTSHAMDDELLRGVVPILTPFVNALDCDAPVPRAMERLLHQQAQVFGEQDPIVRQLRGLVKAARTKMNDPVVCVTPQEIEMLWGRVAQLWFTAVQSLWSSDARDRVDEGEEGTTPAADLSDLDSLEPLAVTFQTACNELRAVQAARGALPAWVSKSGAHSAGGGSGSGFAHAPVTRRATPTSAAPLPGHNRGVCFRYLRGECPNSEGTCTHAHPMGRMGSNPQAGKSLLGKGPPAAAMATLHPPPAGTTAPYRAPVAAPVFAAPSAPTAQATAPRAT